MQLLLYCCIFILFTIGNGIKVQKQVPKNPTEYEVSSGSNKDLLQCLLNLFNQIFTVPEEESSDEQDFMITQQLFQNSQCVIKSIKSSEQLVRFLGKFLENIKNLKAPEMEHKSKKEKKKAEKIIYILACQIANEFRKDKQILSKLSRTITSFIEEMQLPDPTDPDDEVSQLLSQNLVSCLAYHFNATFQFHLPKEIKQQDKLLKLLLRWNAGCITITAKKSRRVLFYLAKIFKNLLNLSPSCSNKEQREFHVNIKGVVDEIGYKFGENGTITGYRLMLELIDRVTDRPKPYPDIKITKAIFDGIPVIIHEPVKPASKFRPALMFFHGGGWVYRTAEKYLPQTLYISRNLDAVVISVEYRQSPEYIFPVPVEDCLIATKYLMKNAKKFKVDSRRIGVAGDSAGGNMAASVALMMRDSKGQIPKVQVLIYPCIQMFDFNLPSYLQNKEMFGLYKDEMVEFYQFYAGLNASFKNALSNNEHICYDMKNSIQGSYIDLSVIPDEYKKDYVRNETDCDPILAEAVKESMLNPYIFPLMSENLNGLPPALMLLGEFDILRDEGLMYGSRLQDADIPVEEHVIKGGYHGTIDMLDVVDIGKEVMDIIVNYLKKNL